VVSLLEDAVSVRGWWLEQWTDGAAFVAGLVAQDVQDALFDDNGPLAALHLVRGGRRAHPDDRARARR